MTEKKQDQRRKPKKPAKTPSEHREQQRERQPGKPTIGPENHDENVGQRHSQDEPFVIRAPDGSDVD